MNKKVHQTILLVLMILVVFHLSVRTVNASAINKTSVSILVSKTETLEITGTSTKPKWSTSDKNTATVAQSGVVTGIKEGTAVITAKVGSKKYTCKVTVRIGIDKSSVNLYTGQTTRVNLCGTAIKSVKSSDTAVATVSKAGKINGVSAGTATITLSGKNNKQYSCKVTVKKKIPVTRISVTKKLEIKKGQSKKIAVTITPSNASDKTVTWSSSDTNVVTVKKGTVTGKAVGRATITAKTSNGKTSRCEVLVGIKETQSFDDFAKKAAELIKNSPIPAGSGISGEDEYFAKRLIVQTDGTDIAFEKYGPIAILKSVDNLYVLQFSTIAATKKAFGLISNLKNIEYVEPDAYSGTADYSDEGELSSESLSWGTSAIGADEYAAYVAKKTTKSIKVAVVDTGVSKHSYISQRLTTDGYDFVDGDADPADYNGHGTHVAGTIVDCTPGLSVKIMPVRVLDAQGSGSTLSVANGVKYAANHGAKVINLSLGGGHSITLDNSIQYAVNNGVVVVVAAGNESSNTKDYCPAHLSEAVVVSAVDSGNNRAWFSNFGGSVDVAAPGVGIISCWPGGGYKSLDGTSMATPHISAVAAMFRLMKPSYSPNKIETLIKKYTKDLGSNGCDDYYGYGIPDLKKLLGGEVTSVTLDKEKISLKVGGTYTLTATVTPSNATDKTITWSSNNTSIATVSNGKVTAKAAGTTTITAKSNNGKYATCTVTVKNQVVEVTGVSLNKNSFSLEVGGTYTLTATVTPSNATDKTITWSSNNTGIATVSNGKVTAKAAGTATITAKSNNGKYATCTVTVKNQVVEVTGVSLNKNSLSLEVGGTYTLTATVTPSNATDKTITWSSNNTGIATVSNGKVTAKAAGTATITAKSNNGKNDTCTVTVKNPVVEVTDVSLNKNSISLEVGESYSLTATVSPSNATDKTLIWSSSDTGIATVSSNGKVTAKSVGTTKIFVRSNNGCSAVCEAVVRPVEVEVEDVSFNTNEISLNEGEQYTLVATVTPSNATDKSLVWSTRNSDIALVDQNGKVTAKAGGKTVIMAESCNGKTAVCFVEVIKPVENISLNKSSVKLEVDDTYTLKANVTPSDATDKTLTWSSNNSEVVTVNLNGKLTANMAGMATIMVKSNNGRTATCSVTVENPSEDENGDVVKTLIVGQSKKAKINAYTRPKVKYSFCPEEDGEYYFTAENTDCCALIELYDSLDFNKKIGQLEFDSRYDLPDGLKVDLKEGKRYGILATTYYDELGGLFNVKVDLLSHVYFDNNTLDSKRSFIPGQSLKQILEQDIDEPSRTGYSFLGWSDTQGGEAIKDLSSWYPKDGEWYYPVWKKD